jgi:hypothetical protein
MQALSPVAFSLGENPDLGLVLYTNISSSSQISTSEVLPL